MTPLFTPNQEMFFVILTLVFIVALIGDFSKARFFRSYRNTPNPWKELSKDMRLFFFILISFFTWAQNKLLMPGGGESMSVVTLEGGSYNMMEGGGESGTGITWALLSGLPPFTSNAVLIASQFTGGFACVGVTNIQPSGLNAPEGAIVYTNWPYAVARQSVLLPQGCLPEGFTFGGRAVTNLYVAASGMLSFDGPKSSPTPATNGIPDGTAASYIAVLQTPSDIVPTNGIFWYATGTNSSLFTWKDVYLGQDTNCLATVQAELFANGDFTCRYLFPSSTNSYAQLTNVLLIGSQNNLGGETVLHTNALLAIHPSFMPAFELRWKSLAGLNPEAPDQDSDGITTADELFIHRTNPRRLDTDGDGISDHAEIGAVTDPRNPDTNNDGIPDGIDLTGYSLSDTNLVFKLINSIAPSVDPHLDTDNDGWADWLELRFGTQTNYLYSTPEYSDALFSVTVTLEAPPPETGVLSVGTNRVMVTGPGSWTFWRTSGEAHPVGFTSPTGMPPSFQITLNRPDAARYNRPAPDGKGGDFGKVTLPLITFDPAVPGCCHEARTPDTCQTYTAYVMPPMPGTYDWETYKSDWYTAGTTWTTNATNAMAAGHDIDWIRLQFTPSGASLYREVWAPVHTHCAMGGIETNNPDRVSVNNNDDDADEATDITDTEIIGGDTDLQPLWPLGRFDGFCCACPEHQPFASIATLAVTSQNLALYTDSHKTNAFSGTIHAGEAVHVEGLTPSTEPYAEKLVWQWTEDNETKSVTNALTVLSVRLFPDLDTDDDVDATDIAGLSALSPEHGWLIPAVTNVLRKLRLRTDVGLQGGAYTLSLSGDGGVFKIWTDNSGTNAAPLLSCGQVITNGVGGVTFLVGNDTDLYVEVASNGTATITYTYIGEGDASNISCFAELNMTAYSPKLLADTNRDGDVDQEDDADKGEAVTFQGPKGAVILANTDDDVADQAKQPDCSDNVINGSADLPDVYTLKVRKLGISAEVIPDGLTFTLHVDNPSGEPEGAPDANARVRIFPSRASNADGVIGPDPLTSSVVFKKEPGVSELDIALLAGEGYLDMGIEGIEFGRQVIVRLSASLDDNDIGSDSVRLLVAPYLVLSSLAPATKVFIGADSSEFGWPNFYTNMTTALTGVVPLESYCPTTFIQDKAEIGYSRSAPGQSPRGQSIVMSLGGDFFRDFTNDDMGYFQNLIGIAGGNLEASPPFNGFDYGRVIMGSGKYSLSMATAFFKAQKIQTSNGALIELPVGWLQVGHVDEVFTIIPTGTGFKVLVADLELAIQLLRDNPLEETIGDFKRRNELLTAYDNQSNATKRALINSKLATIRSLLSQTFGITESNVIRVPVAFEMVSEGSVRAELPNMINMVVVSNSGGQKRLIVPDPCFDPFVNCFLGEMEDLNYQTGEIYTVDTTGPHFSGSAGGEAHCASNVRRQLP